MNMKKTIAGTVASIVAVSAIAATVASAKEISYAAIDKTFALTDKGYKSQNYEDDYVIKTDGNLTAATDDGDVLFFASEHVLDEVKLKVKTINTATGVLEGTKTYKLEKNDKTVTLGGVSYSKEGTVWMLTDEAFAGDFAGTPGVDGSDPADGDFTDPEDTAPVPPADTIEYEATLEYEVVPEDTGLFDSKNDAEDENNGDAYTITPFANNADANSLYDIIANIGAWGESNIDYDVESDTDAVTLVDGDDVINIDENADDIAEDIGKVLEARTKAQIIFNFEDPDFAIDEDDAEVTAIFGFKTFRDVKETVDYDDETNTATFNWGDITKSATSGSTIGDISFYLNSIEAKISTDDDNDDQELKLESITVKGPAESYLELSAGEAINDSAADITTAPADTAAPAVTEAPAATTAAAANPTTGNAPIALAVIPVAIAAAAIIAKKRG